MARERIDDVLLWVSGFIPVTTILVYLIQTRFWKSRSTRLDSIIHENDILKRQIEQRELKMKLAQFDDKEVAAGS